ncbi:hypothetical protein ACVWXM_006666 [Bradyrhizobium sp. GM7.3]
MEADSRPNASGLFAIDANGPRFRWLFRTWVGRCHRRPGNPLRQAGIAVVTLTKRLPHDGSVVCTSAKWRNRGSAGKSRYRPSREPRARCDFKANAGSGEAVNIWNQIQAVMRGRRIIVSTRRLPLLELELGSQRAEAFRNCTMLAPAWTAFRIRKFGLRLRRLATLRRYGSDPFSGYEELSEGKIVVPSVGSHRSGQSPRVNGMCAVVRQEICGAMGQSACLPGRAARGRCLRRPNRELGRSGKRA